MTDFENLNEYMLGYEYVKSMDEKRNHELLKKKLELLPKQEKLIAEQREYMEKSVRQIVQLQDEMLIINRHLAENRKSAKRSHIISIISIAIAFASLIVTIIALFVN